MKSSRLRNTSESEQAAKYEIAQVMASKYRIMTTKVRKHAHYGG